MILYITEQKHIDQQPKEKSMSKKSTAKNVMDSDTYWPFPKPSPSESEIIKQHLNVVEKKERTGDSRERWARKMHAVKSEALKMPPKALRRLL